MFTDSPFEIEASDIDTLVRAGDAVTLPDGRVALPVLLVLASASGKTFTADEFPTAMHLTNGVQVRRMVFEHLGAVTIDAHAEPEPESESAAEPVAEASADAAEAAVATPEAAAVPAEPAAEPAAEPEFTDASSAPEASTDA